jgi:hypothetical protein
MFEMYKNWVTTQQEVVFENKATLNIQGGSNMTGTNCDLFTYNQSRSYLNHFLLC